MGDEKRDYEADTETMWIFRRLDSDGDLVPKEELVAWGDRLKEGETEDGRDLSAVNYIFPNDAQARYNYQALAFSGLGTYVGDLSDKKPFDEEDMPEFDTEKDFGIE